MPLYQYQALTEKGKRFNATIDADNIQEAKIKLIRRQVTVLKIGVSAEKQSKVSLSKSELLNLTREISRLLQAGLPLFETLSALEEKYRGQKPHYLLLDLCDSVRSGFSFSESLAKYQKTFDILYTSMISNAEKTGRLGAALQEIGELLSRQQHVRKQLISALLYPAILSGFCLVVLSTLLFYVIPSLKELFEGRELHFFTQVVFRVSEIVCSSKGALAFMGLSGVFLIIASFFLPKWKAKLVSLSFQAPFLKQLFVKVAFVRFSRAAATLLEGGLPLVQAFGQARRVMHHPILERVIALAEEKISQGEKIHAPFLHHPLIPPLIPRMIGIAEEGGKLPFMMRQIAQIYEDELEKSLTSFATVAQPILLLILGGIIGIVLLSVLIPMTDVSSFANG